MFAQILRVRMILGITVIQGLTSDGVSGYVAVRAGGFNDANTLAVLVHSVHKYDPDKVRVKARQL